MLIKGFDKDLKCRGFQFEVGKEYEIDTKGKELSLCSDTVFHFCNSLRSVHSYYSCDDETNRFCEIEAFGKIVSDGEKSGSSHIKVIREITGDELKTLKGIINGNTGLFNTGDRNTGNSNTGDRNTGNRNTGYSNTGDRNTGYSNTGSRNTGYWNTCNYSSGFFCTKEPKAIIFNVQTDMTVSEFRNSKYMYALCSAPFLLTEWVKYSKEEKKNDKSKELIGGYLKAYTYEEACKNWWEEMTEDNKEIVQQIPNFNKDIFFEITGIKL